MFINVKSLRLIQESLNSWSWSRPLCVWTPHLTIRAVTGRKWNNQNRHWHRCEGHWLKSTGWDVRRVQAKRWLLDGLCDRLFPWSFPTSKKWYWKNLTTISNIQRRKMLSIDRRESIKADTDPCRSSSSHRRFGSLLEARAANQMKCHLATNLNVLKSPEHVKRLSLLRLVEVRLTNIQCKCKSCSSRKVSYDGIQRIQKYPLCTGRGWLPSEIFPSLACVHPLCTPWLKCHEVSCQCPKASKRNNVSTRKLLASARISWYNATCCRVSCSWSPTHPWRLQLAHGSGVSSRLESRIWISRYLNNIWSNINLLWSIYTVSFSVQELIGCCTDSCIVSISVAMASASRYTCSCLSMCHCIRWSWPSLTSCRLQHEAIAKSILDKSLQASNC